MGVYAPPGFVGQAEDVFSTIHQPVVDQMSTDGHEFRGLLYAGLMLDDTIADGALNVLEFNARFGDPETQAVLPLLDGDLLPVLEASARGEALPRDAISHSGRASVSVAIVSGGYPGSYETGKPIRGLDAVDDSVDIFHAGTTIDDDGRTVTAGGPRARRHRRRRYAGGGARHRLRQRPPHYVRWRLPPHRHRPPRADLTAMTDMRTMREAHP